MVSSEVYRGLVHDSEPRNHNRKTMGIVKTLDVKKAPAFFLYRRGPGGLWEIGGRVRGCVEPQGGYDGLPASHGGLHRRPRGSL